MLEQQKNNYYSIFLNHKGTLIKFGIIGFVLAVLVTVIQPMQYRSQASVIVIPNPKSNTDGYQAAKTAESYATILSSVIQSVSFYNKVVIKSPSVSSLFPVNENKQRDQWKRDMQATVVPATGILRLNVYNRSPKNSQNILVAAINVLENEGPSYLGGESAALIYMIDTPIASPLPVRPNYPLNLLGGIFAGVLAGMVMVFVREEKFSRLMPEETNISVSEFAGLPIQEVAAISNSMVMEEEPNTEKFEDETEEIAQNDNEDYRLVDGDSPRPIPRINSDAPWLTVTREEKEYNE